MLENEGHWLKLMRTANLPTDANVFLRISGEDIVCTVTKDVNKEVELKVTCTIADPENAQEYFEHSELSPDLPEETLLKEDSNSNNSSDAEDRNLSSKGSQEMLDFASERTQTFNEDMHSKSTTQSDCEPMELEKSGNEVVDSDCENCEEGCSSRVEVSPSRADDKLGENASSSEHHSSVGRRLKDNIKHLEPEIQSKIHHYRETSHKCHLCNFITQDLHSLEKHMKSHQTPPIKKPSSKMTNPKSYCEACQIQFISIDTYQVHKQLYCKGRHEKDDGSSSPTLPEHASIAFKPGPDTVIIRSSVNGGIPMSSLIQPQAIYAAISTNPLILLPCSLVNGQGLVPQTGVMPTGAPGIVLQTGIACPTIVEKPTSTSKLKDESQPSRETSHPIMHLSNDTVERPSTSSFRKRKMSEGDVFNLKKSCSGVLVHSLEVEETQNKSESTGTESTSTIDQDSPLDLSLKKFPCRSPAICKDSVISPGCYFPPNQTSKDSGSPQRTSVVYSPVTASSTTSYSNDSAHCFSTQIPVVLSRQSSIDSPTPSVLHMDSSADKQLPHPTMPPPKLVKQGNNKCEECNIIFYKYDSYLAHKRHYCALRRQQISDLSAATSTNQDHLSDDNNNNHSGLRDSSQRHQMDDGAKSKLDQYVEQFRSVIKNASHSVNCCDVCGVKFSTSDDLEAHQTYYCIKKCS